MDYSSTIYHDDWIHDADDRRNEARYESDEPEEEDCGRQWLLQEFRKRRLWAAGLIMLRIRRFRFLKRRRINAGRRKVLNVLLNRFFERNRKKYLEDNDLPF